jgi:hypothetical protein
LRSPHLAETLYPGNENCLSLACPALLCSICLRTGGFHPTSLRTLAGGTSMAAPHASGVAALIVGKHGGEMSPNEVEKILKESAEDLGKPGNDDIFGTGRVNASRAVGTLIVAPSLQMHHRTAAFGRPSALGVPEWRG